MTTTTMYVEYPGVFRAPILHRGPPRCGAFYQSRIAEVKIADAVRWSEVRQPETCVFCFPADE